VSTHGEIEMAIDIDRAARGFLNIHYYRMRMLLKTAVDFQTPTTGGRSGQSDPPPSRSSRRARYALPG
jgi:hypothetical protein